MYPAVTSAMWICLSPRVGVSQFSVFHCRLERYICARLIENDVSYVQISFISSDLNMS